MLVIHTDMFDCSTYKNSLWFVDQNSYSSKRCGRIVRHTVNPATANLHILRHRFKTSTIFKLAALESGC